MKLKVNVSAESELRLSVNGQLVRCWRDGDYVFDDLGERVEVQVSQVEPKLRWYRIPMYIVGGWVMALLNAGTELRTTDQLRPYLHTCRFFVTLSDNTNISISEIASKVQNDKAEAGSITVEGEGVACIERQTEINQEGFRSALMKGIYTMGGLWLTLLILFAVMCVAAATKGGTIFCVVVLILLAVVASRKVLEEKRILSELRERISGDSMQENA